jgi:uncharacterized protein YjiS (DUF1127 family)
LKSNIVRTSERERRGKVLAIQHYLERAAFQQIHFRPQNRAAKNFTAQQLRVFDIAPLHFLPLSKQTIDLNSAVQHKNAALQQRPKDKSMTYAKIHKTNLFGTAKKMMQSLFFDVRATLSLSIKRRKVFNQTYRELASLTDRELADLGLCRNDIPRIARDESKGINL